MQAFPAYKLEDLDDASVDLLLLLHLNNAAAEAAQREKRAWEIGGIELDPE